MSIDLDAVRERLEREAADVRREIAARHSGLEQGQDGDNDTVEGHLGDSGSITYDRELDETLGENAQDLLSRYEGALARLDAGTYGTCTSCGKKIDEERLEALPYVDLCIDCARTRG